MSSTGACRSIALCVEFLAILGVAWASDCPPASLAPTARVERLRELDRAAAGAMQQHHYAEAIAAYTEQTCLAPDSAGVFYGLGVAQAAAGDFLNARKSFARADRLEPANHLPLAMLARVNFSLGDVDGLKAALRDSAARFPRDANFHTTLARFLVEKKEYDLALAEALRARAAGANDAESQLDLAVLENTSGAYDDAIRTAASLNRPDAPKAARASAEGVTGLSYESLGRREEAITHLREAIRLDPSRENSYLALAFILEKSGRFREAAAMLAEGHRIIPDSLPILLSLGSDLAASDQYREGIQTLNEFVRKSPGEPKAYLQLADAYRKSGDAPRELRSLQELAARKPGYPRIHMLIARALLNLTPPQYREALEELAIAEKSTVDPDVLALRGKALEATGREAEAAEALRQAIALRPMDPGPYYQLGRLYQKLGKPDLARETLARMQYLKNGGAQ